MFDWKELIELSEEMIAADKCKEAHWRCAVSRSYYSVFNLNHSRLIQANRIGTDRESKHSKVWLEMAKNGTAAEKKLAAGAKRLLSARIDADYYAEVTLSFEDADQWVRLAKRLIIETDALP